MHRRFDARRTMVTVRVVCFPAIIEPITVRVEARWIGLIGVPLAVPIQVFLTVEQAIPVGVAKQRIGRGLRVVVAPEDFGAGGFGLPVARLGL